MDAAVFREPRKRVLSAPGGEIAALEFGPPDRPIDVIFVHANGFNAQTYRVLLSPLAAGLRVLAILAAGVACDGLFGAGTATLAALLVAPGLALAPDAVADLYRGALDRRRFTVTRFPR